jgi:DNA-binding beta-propeller fold protein YncE
MKTPTLLTTAAVVLLAGLTGRAPVTAQTSAPNPYRAVESWAVLPDGRPWGAPAGVDIDPDGKSVWVFERCGDNSCVNSKIAPIVKFDASGKAVKSFGAGMFVFPHGFYVDAGGNVWVTDGRGEGGKGHQVIKFSPEGKVLLTLGKAGVAGDGPDTFNMPSDVAVAANGDIFVVDGHQPIATNHRIVKFTKDGKFIKAWGKKGKGPGEFDDCHSIAIDSRGRVFIADRNNLRIQIFDQDGTFLEEWKQFGRPSGLFISKDTLYVADNTSGIRVASAKTGVISAFIPSPSKAPVAEAVAVDATGNIYGGENGAPPEPGSAAAAEKPARERVGQRLMKYVKH